MSVVAIIGGIGCGKSVVTELLRERGAVVVDADVIARDVVEHDGPVLARLVATFGEGVLTPDGALDRPALASRAFADPASTAQMNEILHPAIGVELVRQVQAARERADVVVVAIPLFRAEHRAALGIDLVVCVDCPTDVATARLVGERGMDEADVARRIAAQPSRAERQALADLVLDNSGTPEALAGAVSDLWGRLTAA